MPLSGAAEKIAKEIASRGAVSFARFMGLALYCPVCGYYEKEEDTIGRRGDYYTSVSVGSLFGELLAFQFAKWLGVETLERSRSAPGEPGAEAVEIVEAGAHRGELARDILNWIRRHRPGLFQRLTYWIVEPSDRRRQWQETKLVELGGKVRWAKALSELASAPAASRENGGRAAAGPLASAYRIIFANELLDALPVHRLGWDAKARTWFEWGVTLQAGRFVWTRISGDASRLAAHASLATLTAQLASLLPDGFTTEVCPAAEEWWRLAAGVLPRGRLLTMDYGHTTEELLAPERKEGTLRAYRRHQLCGDVLADPGAQDLTAHVNFSAIQAAGESTGLQTEAFLTQQQFLTRIATRLWEAEGSSGGWTAQRTRQFQTLTHPEHLGRAFRVLIQGRP
jgi:SAM-dependent MidA family methyltransferase